VKHIGFYQLKVKSKLQNSLYLYLHVIKLIQLYIFLQYVIAFLSENRVSYVMGLSI
jgi:hypothetical protein